MHWSFGWLVGLYLLALSALVMTGGSFVMAGLGVAVLVFAIILLPIGRPRQTQGETSETDRFKS
jgi:hypothetical protein